MNGTGRWGYYIGIYRSGAYYDCRFQVFHFLLLASRFKVVGFEIVKGLYTRPRSGRLPATLLLTFLGQLSKRHVREAFFVLTGYLGFGAQFDRFIIRGLLKAGIQESQICKVGLRGSRFRQLVLELHPYDE